MPNSTLAIITTDLNSPQHAALIVDLLDYYALDPMGGGKGLSDTVKAHLVERLKAQSGFYGALAFLGGKPVGLINCFTGFSTFAAQPLLNIHDVVVRAEVRGQGIGQALLEWAATCARQLGCCKLTLEVLSNNSQAMAAYQRAGYAPYMLDQAAGHALLMQKYLLES